MTRNHGLFIAALVAVGLWFAQPWIAPAWSATSWHALVIALFVMALWVGQFLPLPVTGLLGVTLIVVTGVLPAKAAFAAFAQPTLFFIIGALALAVGVEESGLGRTIACKVFHAARPTVGGVRRATLWGSAALALVIPEHAVAAVVIPMATQIIPKGAKHPSIILAAALGAVVGGIVTFLGGARNILAVSILEEFQGSGISHGTWILDALPVAVIILALADLMLARIEPGSTPLTLPGHCPTTGEGRRMAWVMGGAIAAWALWGETVGLAPIALAATVAMVLFKAAPWEAIAKRLSWGVVLMFGGALAIGGALAQSGAAANIAAHTPDSVGLAAAMSMLLTQGISNAAAVATLLPILLPGSSDPIATTLAIALGGGLAFALPMGAPAIAIAWATGQVTMGQLVRIGVTLGIASWFIVMGAAAWWW